MEKGMYAILRFQKHQGYPAKKIEDNHERNKETYASNPDIDLSRKNQNFHIISPEGKYYAEIQRRITEAKYRTCKDNVRFVDALSPPARSSSRRKRRRKSSSTTPMPAAS